MSNAIKDIISEVSRVLDLLGDLKQISVVLYCLGVFLYGAVTHSYDEATNTLTLAFVGIVLSIPGSLLTGALINLGQMLYTGLSKGLS
jgi:hypothetical protein